MCIYIEETFSKHPPVKKKGHKKSAPQQCGTLLSPIKKASNGIEPFNKGFADHPLSHLGKTPFNDVFNIYFFLFIVKR